MREILRSNYFAAALVVLAACAIAGWLIGPIADPLYLGWLHEDPVTMQHAWEAYRADPASAFTLSTTRVSWPLPILVAMFDIVPIVALPLKLLSPLLPPHIQYFGPLFLFNAGLQALFAWLLFEEALSPETKVGESAPERRAAAILAALLLAAAPVLYARFYMGHPPLTAQWMIVAALWLYARSARVGRRSTLVGFALLFGVGGGVNPYLLVMASAAYLATLGRLAMEGRLQGRSAAWTILPFAIGFASLIAFGFFDPHSAGVIPGNGYGFYSANLNSLFNPLPGQLGSSFLPPLPLWSFAQYEGYGYPGAGALLLVVAGLAVARRQNLLYQSFALPLLLLVAAGVILAASDVVTFGENFAVKIPLPEALIKLLTNFRSSGRFIWLADYGLVALAGFVLLRHCAPRTALAVMALAAIVQVADLARPMTDLKQRFAERTPERFKDPIFAGLGPAHRRLIVVPPWQCQPVEVRRASSFEPSTMLALDNGLATNSFYSGRLPRDQQAYHCVEFPKIFAQAKPEQENAYLFLPQVFEAQGASVLATHFCDFGNGSILCRSDLGKTGLSPKARAAIDAARQ